MRSPKITIVVAASDNQVIGSEGGLPWHLPADLRRFKQLTLGHCLVMGRKTYESIGRPLPGRVSIVLSRSLPAGDDPQVRVVDNLSAALRLAPTVPEMDPEEVCVVGGGEIYRQALPLADRIHLTRVHTTVAGDTFFPEIDPTTWRQVHTEPCPADAKNALACTFTTYERIAD